MWSVLSRFFKKEPLDLTFSPQHQAYLPDNKAPVADESVHVVNTMDRHMLDERRRGLGSSGDQYSTSGDSENSSESYDSRQVCLCLDSQTISC